MTSRRWLAFGMVALVQAVDAAGPPAPAIVCTPSGVARDVRQAQVRFPDAMIALGDPHTADPYTVTCAAGGHGRWVDTRTWVYDFDDVLPAGLACTMEPRAGLATLSGRALATPATCRFSTGGPAVRTLRPWEGSSEVEEDQVFLLALDAEATDASIVASAHLVVEGLPERVPVRVLPIAERDALLEAVPGFRDRGVIVALQATRRLPNGVKVRLVWGKGVTAPSGIARTDDQAFEFRVRKAFTAEFHCERERKGGACVPLTPMRITFATPIAAGQAQTIALIGADGTQRAPDPIESGDDTTTSVEWRGPFPERAKYRIELPATLSDESGRTLENAKRFPLAVTVGEYPPLAKFASRFGIVEWRDGAALPVTLRNLDVPAAGKTAPSAGVAAKIMRVGAANAGDVPRWLRAVGLAPRERSVFVGQSIEPGSLRSMTVPKPEGAKAFEVVGIPFDRPGVYVVELESARLGAALLEPPKPMYVPTVAVVTNLGVHLKWGQENSLVWVTALDTGAPVAGAAVSVRDCEGTVHATGTSDADGIVRLASLPARDTLPSCAFPVDPYEAVPFDGRQVRALRGLTDGLMATATLGDDMAIVHSSWEHGIEAWRFGVPDTAWTGPYSAHTILARTLLRAGETVHLKHLFRAQTTRGFDRAPADVRPTHVVITHMASGDEFAEALAWDDTGVADGTFAIPAAAKLGTYEVRLDRRKSLEGSTDLFPDAQWTTASFRVEEFRIPLMRGTVGVPKEPQVAPTDVPVDVAVTYLAGGVAKGAPVVVRSQIERRFADPPLALEEFAFANGAVTEGILRHGEDGDDDGVPSGVHQRHEITLGDSGTARATIGEIPPSDVPRDLRVELEFRDPSGQTQTAARVVPLWPASRLAAIKAADEQGAGALVARVAVVDAAGLPQPNVRAKVDLFRRTVTSHRKRLVGGFYAYDHTVETRRVGALCEGTTDASGMLSCRGESAETGEVILQASVTDDAGRTSSAFTSVFVPDPSGWWGTVTETDRMDVTPERRRVEPGEMARFKVEMPFRAATALVAVEREGIVATRVVTLDGANPTFEVPVEGHWAPNVFVSVLAVRGRVGDVTPTALVDLGRPAFKLGLAQIDVGWQAHRLGVTVATERQAYHVRDTVAVKVVVRTADGRMPPPGGEVALAAVDEGLLELSPNRTWDVLEAMLERRGHAVATATAQMHVVGKRHYGRKAVPAGGGGGKAPTRELFDTLLAWKARVPLDDHGRALVEVPLGDALTGIRIVAVATAGLDRFGTGATTVQATQDLMILPGLPPVVREGDRLRAEVTVRNTTKDVLETLVTPRVQGLATSPAPQAVRLTSGDAQVIAWDVDVPASIEQLGWEIEAAAGEVVDRVKVTQTVRPAVPVRVSAATLVQVGADGADVPVAMPAGALPGRGDVRVTVAPSLAAGLEGVREAMRRYPYSCLEQQISRAVTLGDPVRWAAIVSAMPAHQDEQGLMRYFPSSTLQGSEVLTAYALAVTHAAGLVIPDQVRDGMVRGLRSFVEGRLPRDRNRLNTTDLVLRKLSAIEALSRVGAADASLIGGIAVEPSLWPTSALLDWGSILARVDAVPQRDARRVEAEALLRARVSPTGTTLAFTTERHDTFHHLMIDADVNAARYLLAQLDVGAPADDLGRLARGFLTRQRSGAWSSTVANAWGTLAVSRFAGQVESGTPDGTTNVTLGETTEMVGWSAESDGKTLSLAWPPNPATLALRHLGTGKPWATVSTQAAVPLTAPREAGYRIARTVERVDGARGEGFHVGDTLRVRLDIDAVADGTWVVVDDPVPPGASHVAMPPGATSPEHEVASVAPTWIERRFEGVRAYYEALPAGKTRIEYAIRLEAAGKFVMPPVRVEALYAPESFGEAPVGAVEVIR